jgi:hypothetical protein
MRRCSQYEAVSGKASLIPLVDLAVRLENQAYIRSSRRVNPPHATFARFAIDFQFPLIGSVA